MFCLKKFANLDKSLDDPWMVSDLLLQLLHCFLLLLLLLSFESRHGHGWFLIVPENHVHPNGWMECC